MAQAQKTSDQGGVATVQITASAAHAAGDVVLLGNTTGLTCGIAATDIANGAVGCFEVGGGTYDVVMLTNIAAYTKVWWDDAINKVTTTSTNMSLFGFLLEGGTGANTVVKCLHMPYV